MTNNSKLNTMSRKHFAMYKGEVKTSRDNAMWSNGYFAGQRTGEQDLITELQRKVNDSGENWTADEIKILIFNYYNAACIKCDKVVLKYPTDTE